MMKQARWLPSVGAWFGLSLVLSVLAGCGPHWSETESGSIRTVVNRGGRTLGYSSQSGLQLVVEDGFAFKDLSRNGELDPYEDWRLPFEERARDLASRLTLEQIAGLMLYSSHQSIPASERGFTSSTYGGQPFTESGANAWDLSDGQRAFLVEDAVRHVLVTSVQSPEIAARWSNNVQALVEGLEFGIPANNSSDPRHRTRSDAEFNAGSGGSISMWPDAIGLAATFDPDLVREFGRIASAEYRALGITTALSPQVDLATDPRWYRFSGTFGEDPELSAAMARAYVDGFQSSQGEAALEGGWGYRSVNAMAKHWPGGGAGEGGRDAHFAFGKYAVYPGGDFDLQLRPFLEGAFDLDGGTGAASAVMPYYTISHGQDSVRGESVGNAFSRYVISDLLRGEHGYEGVICTDWGVTRDYAGVDRFGASPWGVEGLTEAARHYKALMAGVDQFGGNNASGPVMEAYRMGVEEHGEDFMRERFEASAVRLLRNIFRAGLFENPYLDPRRTAEVVGSPEFMAAGYEAQVRSQVLLKNSGGALPLQEGAKVYIPRRFVPEGRTFFGGVIPSRTEDALRRAVAAKHFSLTDDPDMADAAVVVIASPESGRGYDAADAAAGGNGYLPISLQYGPYTASHAREQSLAGGDPLEGFANRSYRGKTVVTSNVTDLDAVKDVRAKMAGKPVIVVLRMANPAVVAEFEADADAILAVFGVQDQAILDILGGRREPAGLLPFQMPADMRTVEEQFEDSPRDMRPHVDTSGNAYDFGFGLDWAGVIDDQRTRRFRPGAGLAPDVK